MERIPTCARGLDDILGGGLPADSISVIAGPPGSGKTILAQQIIYGNATPEACALYLTTVSEPMGKVVRYCQELTFFDETKIGTAVIYEELGEVLQQADVTAVVDRILVLLDEYGPRFLAIDSFKAIHDLADSTAAFRRALYRLAGYLTALSCTTLLVGEYVATDLVEAPELAVVDSILTLDNRLAGVRDQRSIRVAKLRGSAYHGGEHAMTLGGDGITVFPRFVTPAHPARYAVSRERCPFGIEGLDAMLGGGVLRGSTTLVAGEAETGKTLATLSFLLNGVRQGDEGVFISFQEDPDQLTAIAAGVGWDIAPMAQGGKLGMLYQSPVELNIDQHAAAIVAVAQRVGAQRVVVDSISDLASWAYDSVRFNAYVYSLVQYFKNHGITAILIHEVPELFGPISLSGQSISRIADNAVLLRYVEIDSTIRRAISVVKARRSRHSAEIRELHISDRGLEVGQPFRGIRGLLSGRPLIKGPRDGSEAVGLMEEPFAGQERE
ncbi:MAG: hypothetical protein HY331_13530 [Chloroflexi bacterium]|nr:hypothetical protein [Chloroflexota bacterium]